jgi:hypothetical protein
VFALPNFVQRLLEQPAEPLTVDTPVAQEVVPTEERGFLELRDRRG